MSIYHKLIQLGNERLRIEVIEVDNGDRRVPVVHVEGNIQMASQYAIREVMAALDVARETIAKLNPDSGSQTNDPPR